MVSMTCRCASIKMTIGGTSMNTAAAIATPALARPAEAACCTFPVGLGSFAETGGNWWLIRH